MCALIQVRHLAVCDKHSGIFAFPLSFIALQFGCRGVVAGISPVLLLTCILSWHLYSGSDHITNWNTYARLSDVTLLNKLTPLAKPVHSKGDQSWAFFGRTDAKAETPVLWPPHEKSWLSGKDSDAGRDWGQEEKGTTEDEMAGWHHWLDGRESEWTLGVGDG